MTTDDRVRGLTSDRLLLVEGQDEKNLTTAMLGRWDVGGIQIIDVGGKDNFKPRIDALMSSARSRNLPLSAIGVMRDADNSPTSALESVTDTLRSLRLPVPNVHGAFISGPPSVGVFILPDGKSQGSVEDLCWASVEDTSAAQCSTSYLNCLQDLAALRSKNTAKTLVHAYLAAQEEPYARAGEGALKGYWPFEHPAFAALKEFVNRLAVI